MECKNWRTYSGLFAWKGYSAGESKEGMMSLCTVCGGEFVIALEICCMMDENGDPDGPELEMGTKLIEDNEGCVRRFVRSNA